jgi:hypothetical protein
MPLSRRKKVNTAVLGQLRSGYLSSFHFTTITDATLTHSHGRQTLNNGVQSWHSAWLAAQPIRDLAEKELGWCLMVR